MDRTVLGMLDEAVDTFADEPFALRKTESGYAAISYAETRRRARSFAAWLLLHGFEKGDKASILAEGSPEWTIAEFGLLMAACVSVPLSIKLLAEEIPFRLDHSESRAIFTTRNQLDKILDALGRTTSREILLLCLDDSEAEARRIAAGRGVTEARIEGISHALAEGTGELSGPNSKIAAELEERRTGVREDDIATICYTSGTTGNPKGIMLSHLNYWSNCHDGAVFFRQPLHWRTLLILPVDHSFAHTCGLYCSLIVGLSLWFVDSRGGGIATLRNIPVNLKEANPHLLMTVPALSGNFMRKIIAGVEEKGGFIEKLFKRGIDAGIAWNGDGFNRPPFAVRAANLLPYFMARILVFRTIRKMIFGDAIRYCVGGGALLDAKQQVFFAAFGLPIYQGYGLTEAAPIISSNAPHRHKFGTSGSILPSVECTIRRGDGSLAGKGETGQIVIRGANVMKGYYRNPEASAEVLRDGWLWTGDLAYVDEDGFLIVVGREKALLIAEDGEKHSPEDIEETVAFSTEVIDQIMASCEQKKYTIALVTLDESRVRRLIAEKGIAKAEVLLAVLKDEFYRFRSDPKARKVQAEWIPAAFHILTAAWGEKDGTINSTMKIVRHRIAAVNRDRIEYAYTSEGASTENKRNIDALRTIFKMD